MLNLVRHNTNWKFKCLLYNRFRVNVDFKLNFYKIVSRNVTKFYKGQVPEHSGSQDYDDKYNILSEDLIKTHKHIF